MLKQSSRDLGPESFMCLLKKGLRNTICYCASCKSCKFIWNYWIHFVTIIWNHLPVALTFSVSCQWPVLLNSFPAPMAHVLIQRSCVTGQSTVPVQRMRRESTVRQCSLHQSPQPHPHQVQTLLIMRVFTPLSLGLGRSTVVLPQPVGPMSEPVPPAASVCLRPGAVMGRRTVWTAAMNRVALPCVSRVRCPVSAETSVCPISSSVTGWHTAGTPQMKA